MTRFIRCGQLGAQGVPQPKPGAVTKAHGGVLFLDEIGELHPVADEQAAEGAGGSPRDAGQRLL